VPHGQQQAYSMQDPAAYADINPYNNDTGQPVMAQNYPSAYPGMTSSMYKYSILIRAAHFKSKMCRMASSKHTRCKNLLHMHMPIHRKCKPLSIIRTILVSILPTTQNMADIQPSTHTVQIYPQHMRHMGAIQYRAITMAHP
jgi:hypothetical protein